jgi:hypothetical protein
VFELGTKGAVAVNGRVKPLQDLLACPIERLVAIGVASAAS